MASLRSLLLLACVAAAAASFTGGAARKPAAKKAPAKKSAPKTQGLFSGGVAPKKAPKSKRSISTAKTAQTYIDVTGNAYTEVDVFVPKFDEVGVLPPLGRWDPLQIREQVRHASPSRVTGSKSWREAEQRWLRLQRQCGGGSSSSLHSSVRVCDRRAVALTPGPLVRFVVAGPGALPPFC